MVCEISGSISTEIPKVSDLDDSLTPFKCSLVSSLTPIKRDCCSREKFVQAASSDSRQSMGVRLLIIVLICTSVARRGEAAIFG